ncbi:OsmC family protein [Pedobacter duraquae]|uniref:Putative redox protein n=1 Tax=Pedobacter duraquae TaxID=425511 RepID=A0A4R6IGR0_9SPHI|nr:OsmC family protein [Pedobacter duraquae]TDO21046.1 putative redox protein [Pedobacter duraquae]
MAAQQISAVTELDRSTYKTKIFSGGHMIYADEPESMGGTDEGMNPYALILASLGSCTAITIRMYADRKNIQLEAIRVDLVFNGVSAEYTQPSITRNLTLIGDLTSDERVKLLNIADKCPIHKLLEHPVTIITTEGNIKELI